MTFTLNISPQLQERAVNALEQIAAAVNRAWPPILESGSPRKQRKPEDLLLTSDERLAELEEEDERQAAKERGEL